MKISSVITVEPMFNLLVDDETGMLGKWSTPLNMVLTLGNWHQCTTIQLVGWFLVCFLRQTLQPRHVQGQHTALASRASTARDTFTSLFRSPSYSVFTP